MTDVAQVMETLDNMQKSLDAAQRRLDDLAKENAKLREEVALLTNIIRETANNVPMKPSFPYQPGFVPIPNDIPPLVAMFTTCPKCGLKLDSVMGYVCSQPQCPTGLGGAWCST
jgi:hypothetical protein